MDEFFVELDGFLKSLFIHEFPSLGEGKGGRLLDGSMSKIHNSSMIFLLQGTR
jgi:hypothetical protein